MVDAAITKPNRKKVVKKCVKIKYAYCKDVGYSQTQFPNSLGHASHKEASAAVSHLKKLSEFFMLLLKIIRFLTDTQ